MPPTMTLVNEKDEVIGYKDRQDRTPDDVWRATVLWVTNSRGDVLLARRALTRHTSPGMWGPSMAGTVEKGETYDSNVAKEAAEELGLKNVSLEKGPKVYVQGYNVFSQWYFLTLDKNIEDFTIQEEEVMGLQWISKEKLREEVGKDPDKFTKSVQMYVERYCKD